MNKLKPSRLVVGIKLLQIFFWNEAKVFAVGGETCSRSYLSHTKMNCAMQNDSQVIEEINKIIPPLTYSQHKGQAGRIGIVGGSEEYTGAPYFAALSALKVGADLAHVFCPSAASPVIKSYSPELIVHPLLDKEDGLTAIKDWLPRLGSVVIGPGLGRLSSTMQTVKDIIAELKELSTPIVIDADGLFLVTQDPDVILGYKRAILTPNVVEFRRLANAMNIEARNDDPVQETIDLSKALGDVTIVRKGKVDIIAHGDQVLKVTEDGSPRRCGGQGDLLSGSMATFAFWAYKNETKVTANPGAVAAYGACMLTKKCASLAFVKYGRSTTTTDLIAEIHTVFEGTFEIFSNKNL
uniref:ATP-dependent (S)-NAD(P)H-hydrate dehydratase n=1 Tax=Phallusia mammillata TaxID=59560 RepID=A0A6F9DDH7_9ASCI|nr:ATP-dependent (S)-NAD(P)H-hydrate dehydratase [Phallusia mammillata]